MMFEKIKGIIIDRTNFVNDDFEAAVEKRDTTTLRLVIASLAFDKASSGGVNETAVAEAIVDFASELSSPKLTNEKKEQLKRLFKSFYRGIDEAQTALGIELFEATFDFDADTTALNELADALLQTPPPDGEV